jgi:hypothetical protein
MGERSKIGDESVGGDLVLPSQFFRNARGDRALKSGECQLLVAILSDAIDCFQKHWGARDPAGQRLFREAAHWIMDAAPGRGREASETGFSFEYVCDVLDINAGHVRSELRRWVEKRTHSAGDANTLLRSA